MPVEPVVHLAESDCEKIVWNVSGCFFFLRGQQPALTGTRSADDGLYLKSKETKTNKGLGFGNGRYRK